jgi:DNA-binding phage protein
MCYCQVARLQEEKERGRSAMALTRDFKQTIKARVQRDPAFRRELLREGVETLLNGDVETGKTVLRNYINATIGFVELAEVTHRSPKSLMRMLGPKGNPQAQNLFEIVSYLLDQEGVQFELRAAGVSSDP